MEEVEGEGRIDVAFGAGKECNVVVSRVNKAYTRQLDDRGLLGDFGCHDCVTEVHDFVTTTVFG